MTGEWREALEHTRLFVRAAEHQIPYEQRVTVEQLIDRAVSVSFIAALPPAGREDVARRVRALAQHHSKGSLNLGYVTELRRPRLFDLAMERPIARRRVQ